MRKGYFDTTMDFDSSRIGFVSDKQNKACVGLLASWRNWLPYKDMERAFWDKYDNLSLSAAFGISRDESPVFFAGVAASLSLSIPVESTRYYVKTACPHFKMVNGEELWAGERKFRRTRPVSITDVTKRHNVASASIASHNPTSYRPK